MSFEGKTRVKIYPPLDCVEEAVLREHREILDSLHNWIPLVNSSRKQKVVSLDLFVYPCGANKDPTPVHSLCNFN